MAKPKERTLKRPEEALPPERINLGTAGEIISEWRAISNQNRGRINLGMLGDFPRNHQFKLNPLHKMPGLNTKMDMLDHKKMERVRTGMDRTRSC